MESLGRQHVEADVCDLVCIRLQVVRLNKVLSVDELAVELVDVAAHMPDAAVRVVPRVLAVAPGVHSALLETKH